MNTERRIALALKKQRLLLRSAELRNRLQTQAQTCAPALAAADRLHGGWRWLKRHPAIPVAVLTTLLVARPRGMWRWLRRGWLLWQMSSSWRKAAGLTTNSPHSTHSPHATASLNTNNTARLAMHLLRLLRRRV